MPTAKSIRLLTFCLPGFLVWGAANSGCRSSSTTRQAVQAERDGRHHQAYELYCDEAAKSPSNRGVRRDITRVAPKAAQHWQTQGDRAAAEGRYADAWKLYLKALDITPDNSALASLIRNLEKDHSAEVTPARDEWLASGERTLVSADADDSATSNAQIAESQAPDPDVEPDAAPPPPSGVLGMSPPESGEVAEPPVVEGKKVVPNRANTAEPERSPSRNEIASPPSEPTRDARRFDGQPSDGSAMPPTVPGQFLLTTILSTGDDRFPKKSMVFDGLRIKVLDTDPEVDADFEVSLDGKAAKKARNVRPGRGIVVRGRSGKWFEVVVLTVVDSTESVRFGVRPYDR